MRSTFPTTLLLFALAGWALAGALPAGRPLAEPSAVKAAPRSADEGTHRVSGQDGPPAWHWPGLPGDEVAYRVKLANAPGLDLAGLVVGSAGTVDGVRNALRLRLLGELDEVLLDSSRVFTSGGGRLDTLRLALSAATLAGNDSLVVEFVSSHPDSALWITADDDCAPGNRSWIRAPGTGNPAWQLLDRDLNIRLLFASGAADLHAPTLRLPARLAAHPSRTALPLRVRVHDESRVDTVWVEGSGLPAAGLGLTRLGAAVDPAWEEWSGRLPGALAAEGPVDLRVFARDAAGREAQASMTLEPLENLSWSAGSGNGDRSWQPGFPPTPGLVLGVPVDLAAAAQTHAQGAVVVTGARLWPRGGEGGSSDTLIVRLVAASAEGLPARDSVWVELASARRVGWSGACPGPVDIAFELADPGASQGGRAWILVDYGHASQALLPAALLLEEWAPGESAAGVDAASCSWSWHPMEAAWRRIPAGRLLVDALLEPLGCDRGLPWVADFDQTYADLTCWMESHSVAGGNPGWRSTAVAAANSACYLPDPDQAGGLGEAVVDPAHVSSGDFVFVNSDALGGAASQNDSLFTPWLAFSNGARLSFSTLGGGADMDSSSVLVQRRTDGVVGPWMIQMHSGTPEDSLYVPGSQDLCGILHGVWHRAGTELTPAGTQGELRICFAYAGHLASGLYGNGWAIDSIRVDPAPPATGPFDGPLVKTAELGRIHPNPFNPETVIPFRLRQSGPVRLEVYNVAGQRVATLLDEPHRRAGEYRAVFRPGPLSSGVYLARLEAAGAVDTRRLVYLK